MAEETQVPTEDPTQEAPQAAPETPPAAAPPPAAEAPASPEAAPLDDTEIEEGKVFAVLSYVLSFVGLPFFLVPLIMRNNEFSLYHAKQCLQLWLAGIVLSAISAPLTVVCIGAILWPVGAVILVVLSIMGVINASKGELVPVPMIGKLAVDWFKGIKKA